jgi:hypothetical protein
VPSTFLSNDSRAQELKAEIVAALIGIAPRGWQRIFCDYEWRETNMQYSGNEITVAVTRKLFGGADCLALNLARDGRIITGSAQLAALAMKSQDKRVCTTTAIIKRDGFHQWHFDFAPPTRITAMDKDLSAPLKDPALRRPFVKFAAGDEWLSRIPASYIYEVPH